MSVLLVVLGAVVVILFAWWLAMGDTSSEDEEEISDKEIGIIRSSIEPIFEQQIESLLLLKGHSQEKINILLGKKDEVLSLAARKNLNFIPVVPAVSLRELLDRLNKIGVASAADISLPQDKEEPHYILGVEDGSATYGRGPKEVSGRLCLTTSECISLVEYNPWILHHYGLYCAGTECASSAFEDDELECVERRSYPRICISDGKICMSVAYGGIDHSGADYGTPSCAYRV